MQSSLRLTSMRQNIYRVCFTLDSSESWPFTVRRHTDVECGGLELKKSRAGAHQSALLPSLSYCLFVFASAMYGMKGFSLAPQPPPHSFSLPSRTFFRCCFFPLHPGINRPRTDFFSGVFGFPLKCVFLLHCPDHKYHNLPPDRDKIKIKVHITSPRATCTETHSRGLREGEFRLQ